MSVWRSFEKDFRSIADTFGNLRADWSHQAQIPNHWRIAGGSSRDGVLRCRSKTVA